MAELPKTLSEDKVFKSEDFSRKSFAGEHYTHCTFHSCNFSEALLRNAQFCTCRFEECNFSLAKFEGSRLQEVQFNHCKVVGAEFFKCAKTFFSASFKKSILLYCNFSDLNLKGTTFSASKLKECYFTNTCLCEASFADVDLSGSTFHNADLSKADFSSAFNYDIDPRTNKIKKAKFSLPEAIGLLRGFEITLV